MLSIVSFGSGGTVIGSPGLSFFQRGESVLMKAIRSARFWSVSVIHDGMLLLLKPRSMALNRSWSVGRVPGGVDRHLNVAATKLRGKIFKYGAVSLLPSPRKPWHPQQYRKYSGLPASA